MEKKKTLLIISIIVIVILVVTLFFINKNNPSTDNNPQNNFESVGAADIIKDYTSDNLKITNISFVIIDGESKYNALVTNTGTETIKITNLYVNFLGDNLDKKIIGLTDTEIKPGGNRKIKISIDDDLKNAKNVKYIIETTK